MKKTLAIEKFHVIKTVATNGVSYKYDNRRVKVFNVGIDIIRGKREIHKGWKIRR